MNTLYRMFGILYQNSWLVISSIGKNKYLYRNVTSSCEQVQHTQSWHGISVVLVNYNFN